MTEQVELRTDGPHSPDYTRDVGNLLAEAVRVLNYATLSECPGLDYPGDAYSLLGALYTATMRLPQLFDQVAAFLRAQEVSGTLGEDHNRAVNVQAGIACGALITAREHAEALTGNLRRAQSAIAGLYVKDSTKEETGDA